MVNSSELLEALNDAICVIEVIVDVDDMVIDLRYHHANAAFATHTGVADIEGRLASDAIPMLEPHWLAHMGEVYRDGKPKQFVDEAENSMNRWYEVSLTRIGPKGNRLLACVFREASRRVQADRALHRFAASLVEMDKQKDVFLATVAHEIRNPLQPMRNSADALRELADRDDYRRISADLSDSVEQLSALVESLLDLSRVGMETLELDRKTVRVAELLARTEKLALALGERKCMRVSTDFAGAQVSADVDAVRIEQILTNLVSNAVRYGSEAGSIHIEAKAHGRSLSVAVTDDGVGLEQDSLQEIFEPFVSIDPSSRRQGGLGLGLSVACMIARLHHGRLVASSDGPGKGSTFRLELDDCVVADVEALADPVRGALPDKLSMNQVMVLIDDQAAIVEPLAKMLRRFGNTVHIATDGESGMALTEAKRPGVVLCDIGLPDTTGYEIALRLAGHEDRSSMILVALTGWSSRQDARTAAVAGFDAHWVKPLSALDVVQRLTVLLDARDATAGPQARGDKQATEEAVVAH